MNKEEKLYLSTDDTLDVGKKPLKVTKEDEKIRERLKEQIKNGEFSN